MTDRIHFAHPDEEATFNRFRVYYHGQCETTAATAQCATCGVFADDAEPYNGRDHHEAYDALRERLAANGWSMLCGSDYCPKCATGMGCPSCDPLISVCRVCGTAQAGEGGGR